MLTQVMASMGYSNRNIDVPDIDLAYFASQKHKHFYTDIATPTIGPYNYSGNAFLC